jgi:hypothetical protein
MKTPVDSPGVVLSVERVNRDYASRDGIYGLGTAPLEVGGLAVVSVTRKLSDCQRREALLTAILGEQWE